MRLYLAGPMRGYPGNNHDAFHAVAAELRAAGHEVWSPAEHDEAMGGVVEEVTPDIIARDLAALLQQDGLVLLDDWARSHGACLERHVADVAGLPVFIFDPRLEAPLQRLSSADWRWRAGRVGVL